MQISGLRPAQLYAKHSLIRFSENVESCAFITYTRTGGGRGERGTPNEPAAESEPKCTHAQGHPTARAHDSLYNYVGTS